MLLVRQGRIDSTIPLVLLISQDPLSRDLGVLSTGDLGGPFLPHSEPRRGWGREGPCVFALGNPILLLATLEGVCPTLKHLERSISNCGIFDRSRGI